MASEVSKRINSIVKAGLTPILGDLGFKMRGTNFFLERSDVTWLINVQRSRWNSGDESQFTLNVGVRVKGVVEFYCARSEPFPLDISSCCVSVRIENPVNTGLDCWWKVSATDELPKEHDDAIVQELTSATVGVVERFLSKLESRKQVAEFLAGRTLIDYKSIGPRTAAQRHVYASLVYQQLDYTETALSEIALAIAEAKGSSIEEFVERVRKNFF